MSAPTPLETELLGLIAAEGPISVSRYMTSCLTHPVHGYYMRRDPLGAAGDFTTAPEISQMFGELLGLWAVAVWRQMGSPPEVLLIELGPGRGTLMADALRAAKVVPAFCKAASVHLVEISPLLRERQCERLSASAPNITWHDHLGTIPSGPSIVLANEFFDALPISQAMKTEGGWHERMVGQGEKGRLTFGLHPCPIPSSQAALFAESGKVPPGAVYEWRSDAIVKGMCQRLAAFGGAALVIDYGHVRSDLGDTLQAVRGHGFVDVLDAPGETDLTAHVDFAALARSAAQAGAAVHGPLPQGQFLRRLGIAERAARLQVGAKGAQRSDIERALTRLCGTDASAMGALFKAIGFAHQNLGSLPGFDG